MIKVKSTQTISDIYAKSKVMQRMGANINIDAQMQDLLITSRGIRDGWIDTVQLLTSTIQNKAMQEEEARAEAVAAESIRAAAITAIRAANIAGRNTEMAGANPAATIFIAEEAGAVAAVASIRAATAKAKKAGIEAAAVAIRREEAIAEAASTSIRAAAMQINKDGVAIRAAAMKANEDRAAARATDSRVLAGNPRYGNPRQRQNPPSLTGLTNPSHPFYGVWQHWDPSHKPADQNAKRNHCKSHSGRRMNYRSWKIDKMLSNLYL